MLELVNLVIGVFSAISTWRFLVCAVPGVGLAMLVLSTTLDHTLALCIASAVVLFTFWVGYKWQRKFERRLKARYL